MRNKEREAQMSKMDVFSIQIGTEGKTNEIRVGFVKTSLYIHVSDFYKHGNATVIE